MWLLNNETACATPDVDSSYLIHEAESLSVTSTGFWLLFCFYLVGCKLTGSQLVKKFPAFYRTRRFITAFTSARRLSLSWASSLQSMPPHPTSRKSILILSSHIRVSLPRVLFPLRSPTKTLYTPPLPQTCYMPHPSHSSWSHYCAKNTDH